LIVKGYVPSKISVTPGSLQLSYFKSSAGAYLVSDQPFAALMESGNLSSLIDLRRLHDIFPLLASVDLDAPPAR